jgi:GFO/IDH/MocA oxidoreductase family protein
MAKRTKARKPTFARLETPLKIVVEGVGDVIKNYYDPAFRAVINRLDGKREFDVTFVDKSEYWRHDPNSTIKMDGIIASVREWGGKYLDKSDSADVRQYKALEPDVVIIATPDFTHVDVADEWLSRHLRPEQIFIEKPLTDSLNGARFLLGLAGPDNNGILAFDHYRARLLPSDDQRHILLGFLGKGLRRLSFYFLEDHSGSDESYVNSHPEAVRNGPIENEQRVRTLSQGLILDGMPHVIALLAHFCRVETLLVTRVRAGQYVGVDDSPKKRTGIKKETFADVGFICKDYGNNPVEGTVYVGKGVRGVKALGSGYDYNTKLFDIEGLNGNTARFDLRSSGNGSSTGYLLDSLGNTVFEFQLNRRPYETFLEKLADGDYLDQRLALNIELGKRILEVLEDMKYPIPMKRQIPTYPSGMKGKRHSLYLEEVVESLPVLYGR